MAKRLVLCILTGAGVAALLAIAFLLGNSTASANHVAGATYAGTHSGGGTVSFRVSSNGAQILDFTAAFGEGTICEDFGSFSFDSIAISDHAFSSDEDFAPFGATGSFPAVGTAVGTAWINVPGFCVSSTLTWTATTGAGDVNDDGQVNAIDAALVLQLGAGLVSSLPNEPSGDVDLNGSLNAVDAALILQFIAGLIPGLPV